MSEKKAAEDCGGGLHIERRKECCVFCQAENAVNKCAACNIARYCSKECQKQHWKMHKTICKRLSGPLQESYNEKAKRDLKNGTGSVGDRLYNACKINRLADVESLLVTEGAATFINVVMDDTGGTGFYLAAQSGSIGIAKLLISHGALVNQGSHEGYSPLHIACQNGHTAMASLLIKNGAKINQENMYGVTPLTISIHHSQIEVVSLLLRNGAEIELVNKKNHDVTPLLVAAQLSNAAMVSLLLENHAFIDQLSSHGMTPLYLAAGENKLEVVSLLIENHAKIDLVSQDGEATPLCVATERGHIDMVRLLLRAGADPFVKFGFWHHPVDIAFKHKHDKIAVLLQNRMDEIRGISVVPEESSLRGFNYHLHSRIEKICAEELKKL